MQVDIINVMGKKGEDEMAVTESFRQAVKEKRITRVRIMMKDSLLIDPSFQEFREMEAIASPMLGVLYDEHDRKTFKPESEWDDEYMNSLMVDLINNFSHERILHLKKVIHKLRPVKEKAVAQKPIPAKKGNSGGSEVSRQGKKYSDYQKQKKEDQEKGRYIGPKIATGAVVGAAAAGILAGGVFSVSGGMLVVYSAFGAAAGSAIAYGISKENGAENERKLL